MPWALVESDANTPEGVVPPIQLQFLGRQRFTQSRKPIFKPAGFTPRSTESLHQLPPRATLAPAAQQPRGDIAPLREVLRQSDHSQIFPAQPMQLEPFAHAPLDSERELQPAQRGRGVLPVKPAQRPSPRCTAPAALFPKLLLPGMEEGGLGGAMRSARRGAAFTPRSQAQEDAKAAHRRSMVNGSMKRLMCVPFVVSPFAATCDFILKCYRAFHYPCARMQGQELGYA
jgi:hypothetical protein